MDPESVAAGAAVVAVIVSIATVGVTIYLHQSSESNRRAWELDQDTKRHGWSKDLQDRQKTWEREQEQERREWEVSLTRPKLEVSADYGFFGEDDSQTTLLILTARNTGLVPVRLANSGQIILPDDKIMEPPKRLNPSTVSVTFDASQPLEAGDAAKIYWTLPYLKNQLAKNGYAHNIQIRGCFTDKLGNHHISKPVLLISSNSSTGDTATSGLSS